MTTEVFRFQLKMAQEERKGYLNSCKLTENWRNLRRDAKTKELKTDVVVLKETFDRALQKKNRHIELLMQVGLAPCSGWSCCLITCGHRFRPDFLFTGTC